MSAESKETDRIKSDAERTIELAISGARTDEDRMAIYRFVKDMARTTQLVQRCRAMMGIVDYDLAEEQRIIQIEVLSETPAPP